jgi:hypothetical protein
MRELHPLQQSGLHIVADLAVEARRPEKRKRMVAAVAAADRRAERGFARQQRLEMNRPDPAAGRAIEVRRVHMRRFRKRRAANKWGQINIAGSPPSGGAASVMLI